MSDVSPTALEKQSFDLGRLLGLARASAEPAPAFESVPTQQEEPANAAPAPASVVPDQSRPGNYMIDFAAKMIPQQHRELQSVPKNLWQLQQSPVMEGAHL
jgi:hypothetical protein